MIKYLFLLLLTVICYCSGFGQEKSGKTLLQEQLAISTQDTGRLKILLQLVSITYQNPEEQILYIDQLLDEAKKQKNKLYLCEAYLRYMYQAYNRYDGEEVNRWMKQLEPIARKGKFYDLLFRGKQCVIDMLLLKEQYELEEKEANLMLKEAQELNNTNGQLGAYHSLAHVYMRTYQQDKAFEVLEKAIRLGPLCSNQFMYCEVLRTMTINCKNRTDLPNWFKYLAKRDSLITVLEKNNPLDSFDGDRLMNNLSYLQYFITNKEWEEAAQCMKQIDDNYSEQYSLVYKYYYRESKTNYYLELKDWDKALREIDILLELLQSISQVDYANTLVSKATLLNKIGREQEALDIYKQAKLLKDSLSTSTINKQAEQLKGSYKTELHLLSKAQQQQRLQQVILILAITIILILLISLFHANRVKHKLTKAEQEMRKMMNETEEANRVKERFLANINMTIRPPLEIIVENSCRLASEEELEVPEKKKLAALINATSGQLMELINEILILSKLEAQMMKFALKEVEVIQLVKSTIEKNNQQKPGHVLANIPDQHKAVINGDENYLKQIIDSLCQKALDNNKSITFEIVETEKRELKITIKNTFLATPNPTQETVIRNEINRMLIEGFGGVYNRLQQENNSSITLIFIQN